MGEGKGFGVVSINKRLVLAEGICITSLSYTVAHDKIIKVRKHCENMVYATEMATSDLCLACGKSAVKKDILQSDWGATIVAPAQVVDANDTRPFPFLHPPIKGR